MIFTGKPEPLAFGIHHNGCTAMRAHIIKRVHVAVLGMDNHDRLSGLLPLNEATGFG